MINTVNAHRHEQSVLAVLGSVPGKVQSLAGGADSGLDARVDDAVGVAVKYWRAAPWSSRSRRGGAYHPTINRAAQESGVANVPIVTDSTIGEDVQGL